jgi:putative SOS response-associated peptidase YedK
MCNRYTAPDEASIARYWHVVRDNQWRGSGVFPRVLWTFIRRTRDDTGCSRELVAGQWELIPWFAKEPKLPYSTNNARFEELAAKASFKAPWARGQRYITPALRFDEPCWETGKNVWWAFRRADGGPWGLAGLWNTWVDKATGEVHESYTMLAINADDHPLMGRMHKPDPKLPAGQQDNKRSVVAVEQADVDQWLEGSVSEARELLRVPTVGLFDAVAA